MFEAISAPELICHTVLDTGANKLHSSISISISGRAAGVLILILYCLAYYYYYKIILIEILK
jgi:hypothetical protein